MNKLLFAFLNVLLVSTIVLMNAECPQIALTCNYMDGTSATVEKFQCQNVLFHGCRIQESCYACRNQEPSKVVSSCTGNCGGGQLTQSCTTEN